jgi:hypothetical protein
MAIMCGNLFKIRSPESAVRRFRERRAVRLRSRAIYQL